MKRKHHCRVCGYIFCSSCTQKVVIPKDKMLQKALTSDETEKPQLCCLLCVDNLMTPASSARPSLMGRPSMMAGSPNSSNKRALMQRTESLKSNISSSPGNSGLNNFSAMESLLALSSQLTMTKLESNSEKSANTDDGAGRPLSANMMSPQYVPSPRELPSPLLASQPSTLSSLRAAEPVEACASEPASETVVSGQEEEEPVLDQTSFIDKSETQPYERVTAVINESEQQRPLSFRGSSAVQTLVSSESEQQQRPLSFRGSSPVQETRPSDTSFASGIVHQEPEQRQTDCLQHPVVEEEFGPSDDANAGKAEDAYEEFVRQLSVGESPTVNLNSFA